MMERLKLKEKNFIPPPSLPQCYDDPFSCIWFDSLVGGWFIEQQHEEDFSGPIRDRWGAMAFEQGSGFRPLPHNETRLMDCIYFSFFVSFFSFPLQWR